MRRYECTSDKMMIHGRWPPPPFSRLYLKHSASRSASIKCVF
ncbi:hypothetical protein CEV33_1223 [Brucella grignonensis]|uniref:Uncharacterized protein n=1 Tax=Brucella grignonensis TaxID=94627 RepID=A0A256FC38_9HYPH|nr:hypothetical protein CEV33_1223 [Brucella grignonensis]